MNGKDRLRMEEWLRWKDQESAVTEPAVPLLNKLVLRPAGGTPLNTKARKPSLT